MNLHKSSITICFRVPDTIADGTKMCKDININTTGKYEKKQKNFSTSCFTKDHNLWHALFLLYFVKWILKTFINFSLHFILPSSQYECFCNIVGSKHGEVCYIMYVKLFALHFQIWKSEKNAPRGCAKVHHERTTIGILTPQPVLNIRQNFHDVCVLFYWNLRKRCFDLYLLLCMWCVLLCIYFDERMKLFCENFIVRAIRYAGEIPKLLFIVEVDNLASRVLLMQLLHWILNV